MDSFSGAGESWQEAKVELLNALEYLGYQFHAIAEDEDAKRWLLYLYVRNGERIRLRTPLEARTSGLDMPCRPCMKYLTVKMLRRRPVRKSRSKK